MHTRYAEASRIGSLSGAPANRRAIRAAITLLISVVLFAAGAPDRALGLPETAPSPDPSSSASPSAPALPENEPLNGESTALTGDGTENDPQSNDPQPADDDLGSGASADGTADLEVMYMAAWTGYGTRLYVIPVVRNNGPGLSTGHSLVFAPQGGTDRRVTAPAGCTVEGAGFRCTGGALQPGEMREYSFVFSPPEGPEAWPPFWFATVTGDDPDPNGENDRDRFELIDSTHVQLEADVKTRVEDADGDGRASAGEKAEVYVYFANDSGYELQDVLVEAYGFADVLRHEQPSVSPGEEVTVRFDAVVPDTVVSVDASVSAMAVEGGSFRTNTGRLMVAGPLAIPNPEGPLGPQPEAPEYNPRADVDIDLSQEVHRSQVGSEATTPDVDQREGDAFATEAPIPEGDSVREASAAQERSRAFTQGAIGQEISVASAPSGARGEAAPLAIAGAAPFRGPIIAAVGLIGLGVILAQISLSWRPGGGRERRHG